MNPFPQDWELLSVFEVEPTILDRNVPWCYNTLSFETQRGDDVIRCQIEPGYETFRLEWTQRDVQMLTLDLHFVRGIRVETGNGRDVLIALFRDQHLGNLELQLKPNVSVRWIMNPKQL